MTIFIHYRLPRIGFPIGFLILTVLLQYSPSVLWAKDNRIVDVISGTDKNNNRIHDGLETNIKSGSAHSVSKNGKKLVDVIVCMDKSVTDSDKTPIIQVGGEIKEIWNDAFFGFHALIPQDSLEKLVADNSHIVVVEENAIMHASLVYSTKQILARGVWAGSNLPQGYSGNSTFRVAIMDTGIDTTHPDINNLAGWRDFVTFTTAAPYPGWDGNGHGSHVAGIVAGKGTLSTSTGFSITFVRTLYATPGSGFLDSYPISVGGVSKKVWGTMKWNSGGNGYLGIYDPNTNVMGSTSGTSALTTLSAVTSNVFNGGFMVLPAGLATPPAGRTAAVQVLTPYESEDGFKELRGMASNSPLVGLRVLWDNGSGDFADYVTACNWLVSSCAINNIVVANSSLGAGYTTLHGRISSYESAVNNAVNAGCAMVIAAGNDQGEDFIGEPAYSANAITVAAVDGQNKLTNYSSLGVSTETIIKPDVSAPGGGQDRGITSVDSNDVDEVINYNNGTATNTTDQYPNDYQILEGTSMASPHVAGLVALIADAKGSWSFGTNTDPFFAKKIILMTAWETQASETSSSLPPLNRGGKDLREGYGRVNADACIEAVTQTYTSGTVTGILGSDATTKKVWARNMNLSVGTVTTNLVVPGGADYDLFLYRYAPDSIGQPVLLSASTSTLAANTEQIIYSSPSTQTAYIVVKQVSGSGQFSFYKLVGSVSVDNWREYNKDLNRLRRE